MHRNARPWLDIFTLVVERVGDPVKPSAKIRDPFSLPVVHGSMDPVEMSISPDRISGQQDPEGGLILFVVKVPVIAVAKGVQEHEQCLPECSCECGAHRIDSLSL